MLPPVPKSWTGRAVGHRQRNPGDGRVELGFRESVDHAVVVVAHVQVSLCVDVEARAIGGDVPHHDLVDRAVKCDVTDRVVAGEKAGEIRGSADVEAGGVPVHPVIGVHRQPGRRPPRGRRCGGIKPLDVARPQSTFARGRVVKGPRGQERGIEGRGSAETRMAGVVPGVLQVDAAVLREEIAPVGKMGQGRGPVLE